MFDSIVFKNTIGPGPLIDIGALAEALLFYGRVAIVGNSGTIKDLLARIPPFVLLSLMRDKRIEIHYLADQVGVSSVEMSNGRSLKSLVRISSPDHTIEKIGPTAFRAATAATGQSRIGASQFTTLLRPFDHYEFDQVSVLNALSDNISTTASVEALIRSICPQYAIGTDFRFNLERENNGFYVDTNINFIQLNEQYHKVVPVEHSSITDAYIVSLLQGAYEATYFAGALNSEVAVHPIERAVQAKAIEAVVRRHKNSASQIESFIELTLTDGRAIREAVNSGAVSFTSVVKLLDSADKFRHWLREQPAEASLVQAYYHEAIKDSWADRLPAKSVRWSFFTSIGLGLDALGAGGLGTAAGVAIGAVDTFLMDKLIKGWKPHQFVESELAELIDPNAKRKITGSNKIN